MLEKIPYFYKRMEIYDNIVSDFSLKVIEENVNHLPNHWYIFYTDIFLMYY